MLILCNKTKIFWGTPPLLNATKWLHSSSATNIHTQHWEGGTSHQRKPINLLLNYIWITALVTELPIKQNQTFSINFSILLRAFWAKFVILSNLCQLLNIVLVDEKYLPLQPHKAITTIQLQHHRILIWEFFSFRFHQKVFTGNYLKHRIAMRHNQFKSRHKSKC